MHKQRPLEYCYLCGAPTERAGKSDDSLYCDECDLGPFCIECFIVHHSGNELLTALETITYKFDNVCRYCDDGWVSDTDLEVIEAARAAIAKAKGEDHE